VGGAGTPARHLARAVVAEVALLRTATRIRIRQTKHRSLPLSDFLAAVIADENRFPSQLSSFFTG
jgi:hypothetical protein